MKNAIKCHGGNSGCWAQTGESGERRKSNKTNDTAGQRSGAIAPPCGILKNGGSEIERRGNQHGRLIARLTEEYIKY